MSEWTIKTDDGVIDVKFHVHDHGDIDFGVRPEGYFAGHMEDMLTLQRLKPRDVVLHTPREYWSIHGMQWGQAEVEDGDQGIIPVTWHDSYTYKKFC